VNATDQLVTLHLNDAAAALRRAIAAAEAAGYGQIVQDMHEAEKQVAFIVKEIS
jgi:hypothetical protein